MSLSGAVLRIATVPRDRESLFFEFWPDCVEEQEMMLACATHGLTIVIGVHDERSCTTVVPAEQNHSAVSIFCVASAPGIVSSQRRDSEDVQ
jgi:hypothetical protein